MWFLYFWLIILFYDEIECLTDSLSCMPNQLGIIFPGTTLCLDCTVMLLLLLYRLHQLSTSYNSLAMGIASLLISLGVI
jgi:hypothetical protein